jgi:hypothetical protein
MSSRTSATVALALVLAATVSLRSRTHADAHARDLQAFNDESGVVQTVSTNGAFDIDNPFFQSLGTNGRACVTCHQSSDGWSITPQHVKARFAATKGEDPLFRLNDGATCPSADVSTLEAKRDAYGMLLSKGLIRVGIGIPANAEFSLLEVDDPYDCATAMELSLFRRPLPSTNLRFLSGVMWDARESAPGRTLAQSLRQQAIDATLGHAQASVRPTDQELDAIVALESGLVTAQMEDRRAGRLNQHGGAGGPDALARQDFFIGVNDPLGFNPTGAPFDPRAFTLFSAWQSSDWRAEANRAIARGQEIFNTRPIAITGVKGLNDALGVAEIPGTCTTCHDSPNVGNHSVALAIDIGVSDASRRTPDMPLYTLKCTATGEIVKTMDPGRALITGRCADIGKTKGPVLRALAARAPYFHNGSAASLIDVVTFYDERFNLGLTPQEKADLVAFLRAL